MAKQRRNSDGLTIPDILYKSIQQRILTYAETYYAGKYTRIELRFKGKFCYIDAYTEPQISPEWPPADFPETREEYIERLRNTPTHLCRLQYLGKDDAWSFAFYTYSNKRYEPCDFPNGTSTGTPEEAFEVSANVYLNG